MLCLKDCRDQQNIQELTIPEECGYKNIKKKSLRVGYMLLMISNLQKDLIYQHFSYESLRKNLV